MDFSFITYSDLPELDPDDQLIVRALNARETNSNWLFLCLILAVLRQIGADRNE